MIILRQNNYSKYTPDNLEDYTDPETLKNSSHKDKLKAIDEEFEKAMRNHDKFKNHSFNKSNKILPLTTLAGTIMAGAALGIKSGHSVGGKVIKGLIGANLALLPAALATTIVDGKVNHKFHKAEADSKSDPEYRTIDLAKSLDKGSGKKVYENYALEKIANHNLPKKVKFTVISENNEEEDFERDYTKEELKELKDTRKKLALETWESYSK